LVETIKSSIGNWVRSEFDGYNDVTN